ncbi:MAG TPA: ATP-binding cassette domain-containing protein [Candidatus Acidoferrum sp.]|nr:ATP-binding cassette domain-containing protein [Candidatus Acidoferrum sp.]
MLTVTNISKTFNKGTVNEKTAIDHVSLTLAAGEYVTLIGGNGAGKSTLLSCIAGVYGVDGGKINIDGSDVTKMAEHERAYLLGRVFQDPMMGTAAGMSIEENLALAHRRGARRTLRRGITKEERELFKKELATLELGLEERMTGKVGLLSGGQRQALTLLMANIRQPKLLLLDEHTAALDPKTAMKVLELSDKVIEENGLTAMMVTHNMRAAIKHGNRMIMMANGKIILDVRGEEKQSLTVEDLMVRFHDAAGSEEEISDRMVLSS